MTVRAKFKVDSIERTILRRPVVNPASGKRDNWQLGQENVEMRTVKLSPVFGNGDPNHENTKFWEASPGGKLELNVINLEAAEAFGLGEEFYVDFTKAG